MSGNKSNNSGKNAKPFKKKNNWHKSRAMFAKFGSPQLVSDIPQINIGPQYSNTSFCPYKAWKHYFPMEEYESDSGTVNKIKLFESCMTILCKPYQLNDIAARGSIAIDCKELAGIPHIIQKFSNILEVIKDEPESIIACLGIAAHQYIIKSFQQIAATSSSDRSPSNVINSLEDVSIIRARLYNYEPLTSLKHLKARSVGKFVTIKGTLVKVSNVKPLCTTMAFKCNTCGCIQTLLLINYNYALPSKCIAPRCKGRSFEPQRNHLLTEITDWQLVKLQEIVSEEQREAGRMPRTVEIELTRDLSDSASPGDVVTVSGIVRVKKFEDSKWRKGKDKSMYLLHIEGNYVSNSRSKSIKDCRENQRAYQLEFSDRDLAGIKEIQKQDDVFSLLTCSLCPTIYGQDMVKAGLLLALFGGNQQYEEDKTDTISVRGNSHVLLVGDPGLGKSQLLQAVSRLAPRGVYVCGNASSNSGLTVTLSRDSGSGDTTLEAGALVLADQGVCCIDEFDKMSSQHQALLEAMEQQCISIAKAGIVCSMPARCSIVAAANPVGGHYDKSKTVSENLKMGGALLSRFDLVYILLDTPNQQRDKLLSDHVMSMHTGRKEKDLTNQLAAAFNQSEEPATKGTLKEKLISYSNHKDCEPIPHYLVWKYIAYARKNKEKIALTKEACQVLKGFYLELRQKGHGSDSTPITTRQLESMKRLTEARCKLDMRTRATANDASDVVEIMRHCLYDTLINEANDLEFERSFLGSGVSKRSKVKRLIAALNKVQEQKGSNMFTTNDIRTIAEKIKIDIATVSDLIDTLNNQGFLLKSGANMYKLQIS